MMLPKLRGRKMNRREFTKGCTALAVLKPTFAFGQQNQSPRRIGLMANLPLSPVQRFRERLQKLGWVDDRFPAFAAELVSMPVDVLVVWGSPAAFAAKRATSTIPILIGAAGDVVNTGLISTLARPDANLTGFIALNVDLEGKRLELLKEAIPHLTRVAVLANSANPISRLNLDIARDAAGKLGVKIEVVEASWSSWPRSASPRFTRFVNTRASAVCLFMEPISLSCLRGLPTI
jgi:putative tryptophan/tyrosine transport system substrate-binding protein